MNSLLFFWRLTFCQIVFEDKTYADQSIVAVEKQIHQEDNEASKAQIKHIEIDASDNKLA